MALPKVKQGRGTLPTAPAVAVQMLASRGIRTTRHNSNIICSKILKFTLFFRVAQWERRNGERLSPRLRKRVVEAPQPYFTFSETFDLDAQITV